jgi:hypothetical protein
MTLARFAGDPLPVDVAAIYSGLITARLIPDQQYVAPADGAQIRITRRVKTLFPPGFRFLQFGAGRANGVANTDARFVVNGYLLPPGGIGRV